MEYNIRWSLYRSGWVTVEADDVDLAREEFLKLAERGYLVDDPYAGYTIDLIEPSEPARGWYNSIPGDIAARDSL